MNPTQKTPYSDHLTRIQEALDDTYSLTSLSNWVEKYLYLEGKKLSFENYEFQRRVMDDPSRVVNTVKCAQIGLTVTTMAYFLSVLATQRMNVIYALPTAGDAGKLVTTKLNPIIYNTPELKRLLNVNVDSIELKEINGNFLFTRGTKSDTAALSISADLLVVDELDRADPDVLKQFRSRLQASPHKLVRQFSTPTIAGLGIDREAQASVRYRHFASCYHCEHKWLPDYWSDILIPDFEGSMRDIDRMNLKDLRWREARWRCPECGKDPQLHSDRLEWVAENGSDNFEATTYYVGPVTAHRVLKPDYLVRSSTEFNSTSEFVNQVLGETSEEQDSQLVPADIEEAIFASPLESTELHFMGADMGQLCHVCIGRIAQDGTLLLVHKEAIPLANFEARRRELCARFRVITSVHDTQPETHLVTRITDSDPNAWGAIFSVSRSTELFVTQQKTADAEEGKLNLRLVKIARTAMLDKLLMIFKERKILVARSSETARFTSQMLSMKRTQEFVKDELTFVWKKTNGQDHYHFALIYLLTATLLRGTAGAWTLPGHIPLLSTFRLKQ
jgi:Phage terminase large subunit (GpA)